jgi:hypothetical protein
MKQCFQYYETVNNWRMVYRKVRKVEGWLAENGGEGALSRSARLGGHGEDSGGNHYAGDGADQPVCQGGELLVSP